MFITELSTTCFGAYGHLQVDELTKNTHKRLNLACVFYTEDGIIVLNSTKLRLP